MGERAAMERALDLALGGWGRVAPNPMVGAVLLRDGAVVGEGFHAEFGGPHAEVAALAGCDDPRGAICVVSLEPCNHRGKTPPCTDALISAGVGRVVAAVRDPNAAAGGGVERLREAGIDVEIGLCGERAAALNAPFLWAASRPERPFVAVKVATSLDGYLADLEGNARWVSGPEAREFVHWLRSGFDGIAVGRRTAVADDPQLTVRGGVTPRVPPVRVIVSGSGDVPPDLTLVTTAGEVPTTIVTAVARAAELAEVMRGTAVRVVGADGLSGALQALRAEGIATLLVEGGGALASAFLAEGLVDRVYWVQAPIWLGEGTPAFGPRAPHRLFAAPRWTVTDRRALGPDTLLVVDRELCLRAS